MCLGGDVTGSGSLGTSPQLRVHSGHGFCSDSGGDDGTDGCSSRGPQAPRAPPASPFHTLSLGLGVRVEPCCLEEHWGPKRCRSPKERFINRSGVSAAGKPSTRPPHPSRLPTTGTAAGSRGLRRRLLKLWNPKTPRATAALAASGCGRGAGRDPPPPPPPPLPPPPAPRLRRARAPQAPPAPTRHTPTRFSARPALPAAPRRPPLSVRTRGAPAACSRLPPPALREPPRAPRARLRAPGPGPGPGPPAPFPPPSDQLGRGAPSRGSSGLQPRPAASRSSRSAASNGRWELRTFALGAGGTVASLSGSPWPGGFRTFSPSLLPLGERRAGPSRRRRPLTPVAVTVQLPGPGPGPGPAPAGEPLWLVVARRPAGLRAQGSRLARHSKWAPGSGLGSRTQESRERDAWRGAAPLPRLLLTRWVPRPAPRPPPPAVAEALPAVLDGVDKRAVRGGCCAHLSPVQEEDCKPITGADKDTLTEESIPEEANFDPRHKCSGLNIVYGFSPAIDLSKQQIRST
ncbi:uncharacterized protein [Vulpes vulpes]|uniref:Basic proline-rich protein-like n=1 Tax=Vulpes vulpes TaxID=9627 RepID=A0ABM4Z586_VULVU